ncbi:glycoside hydrolase family 2 protein [Microbacterium sp. zg-Y818]|uniref:glycoside hydrolase family 2 protein n=1 Tax=unclassified Microbacterium TaxID=2609290 RepID=UPI00214C8182|nr:MULTISPECIES: glycoside hydrolase family 2 protein [unclassified Microbacterium]MCR2801827.1 glycoside hydrolase family 2 protein [Microbacterium sp. zg.Y818]WIM22913.1 glycoside hydrolase family 2 protein [Microbacterium sp. zg-Y818]
MSLERRELHDGWTAQAAAGPAPAHLRDVVIPAAVPGTVHTDLLAAGLIPDPYRGANENLLAWIGLVDWTYRTTFAWTPDGHTRHDLVFDGIDTVAELSLNGHALGDVANQHRSYRFAVDGRLIDGDNELVARFRAPVPYANAQSLALGARPRPYPLPYEAIRKSACNFGWDWGIATYTSGLWRPVRLESWSVARLAEVRVTATPDGAGGAVDIEALIERSPDATDHPLTARLAVDGPGVPAAGAPTADADIAGDRVHLRVTLDDVRRWWPAGYGDQPRYDVDVQLAAGDLLDATRRAVGFRTVRWDTEPDAAGTPFTLVVNDQPVFVKGVNWIPDDALPARVDRARYEQRLRQAVAANLNLVRVWGGGIYESDDFYDLCDQLGLLTWQDFLFACAAYPEEEPLRSEIEAEARQNIVRLASHPSLVLLTGNNENLWGFEDWGWKRRLDGATWGAHYYYALFPGLVAELAPHVPYSPGSPFSPGTTWDGAVQSGFHPNDEAHGTTHLWEQWNRRDWPTYREHRPRFVAEFGWQGPPTWTTLTGALDDDPLTPESPGMIVHQKAQDGNVKLADGLLSHFRMPADMETWHWAMQLNQAVAVRTALEHFRSWAPHTMGAVVWQLNDCWPVTSWAAVDGEGRAKPLFHALRAAFAPRLVTVQPREDGLAVVLGNDTAEAWAGTLRARRLRFDGTESARVDLAFQVAPRASTTIGVPRNVADPADPAAELLVAETTDERGLWFFVEPRDSALPDPDLSVSTEVTADGTVVTVTTDALARDLTLLADKVHPDAHATDGLITLLPGESARVLITGAGALSADALRDPRVLRTANQLVVR